MNAADPRILPIVELDRAEFDSVFASIVAGASLREIELVQGGLVNTVYRVTTSTGTYALRLYADHELHSGDEQFEREVALLSRLGAATGVPMPRIAIADASRTRAPTPYVVYPWIDGVTLNDCRHNHGAAALTSLADPLGRVLASTAALAIPLTQSLTIEGALIGADAGLSSRLVRNRLGPESADALRALFDVNQVMLLALDEHRALVHGDFGGRNVLVHQARDATWYVSGVIDWDAAAIASPLWDVGSLFRYASRYPLDFRERFARAYRAAGGRLPDEWWRLSRLIDATRVVRILGEEHELPVVFDECRSIVADLIADVRPNRPHFVRNRATGR